MPFISIGMTDDEFKQKLSEVAEWEIPKLAPTVLEDSKRRVRVGRKSKEEQYQEEHEEVFLDMFEGVNPTHHLKITKIKFANTTCEDCGAECPNGRKTEAKIYTTTKRHWRERCVVCDKFKNPLTGKFDLIAPQANALYNNLNRETKGTYQSKFNQVREDAVIIRTADEIYAKNK